jgi:hypothetical protein
MRKRHARWFAMATALAVTALIVVFALVQNP